MIAPTTTTIATRFVSGDSGSATTRYLACEGSRDRKIRATPHVVVGMSRLAAVLFALAVLVALPAGAAAAGRCGSHPWCDTSKSPDERAGLLLGALTRDEKISLLAGDEVVRRQRRRGRATPAPATASARVELPTTYYSDGPVGTRQGPSTALPSPIALAATFDRVARLPPRRAWSATRPRSKGNDVVFAPTVNIMRTPLGGRTFEGYGEDPFLVSRLGGRRGSRARRRRA